MNYSISSDLPPTRRSHNEEEASRLRADGAGIVCLGEAELARAMVRHVLSPSAVPAA